MKPKNDGKRRFRRSPGPQDIGEVVKKIWKPPKFMIREKKNRTEFVFFIKFNIARKIKGVEPAVHRLLFGPGRPSFRRVVKQAWRRAYYGRERVRDLTERVLLATCVDALAALYEEADLPKPLNARLSGGAEAVRNFAKRKRRPDSLQRKATAKRVAGRYAQLFPEVQALWKKLKSRPRTSDENSLKKVIEGEFCYTWIPHVVSGKALQNLPDIPAHGRVESLNGMKWTPRQLTVGIIWCEERERNQTFTVQPNTLLEDYLPLGRKLNRLPT
jgi:hypothetical protein